MRLDAALTETDPLVRTMALSLRLLTRMLPTRLAIFYAVNGRLEKYASGPIVAATGSSIDAGSAIQRYRARFLRHDPFSPARAAGREAHLLTPHDFGGPQSFARSWYARELAKALSVSVGAELYLRSTGRIVAGVSLMRDLALPEVSRTEIEALGHAQPLLEASYALAYDNSPLSSHLHAAAASALTRREREVLHLLARGASNSEIGRALQISLTTVKTHVHNVLVKLGASDRREILMRFGLGLAEDLARV